MAGQKITYIYVHETFVLYMNVCLMIKLLMDGFGLWDKVGIPGENQVWVLGHSLLCLETVWSQAYSRETCWSFSGSADFQLGHRLRKPSPNGPDGLLSSCTMSSLRAFRPCGGSTEY